MAESQLHKERVAGLVRWLTDQGVEVTNASGGLPLPDPEKVGRHEPDACGYKNGFLWIGEAKTGDDLDDPTSQEQFADFSQRQMSATAKSCPFVLCVPPGYEERARQAVINAGGSTANLTVIA